MIFNLCQNRSNHFFNRRHSTLRSFALTGRLNRHRSRVTAATENRWRARVILECVPVNANDIMTLKK
jgi:hypothetical protein